MMLQFSGKIEIVGVNPYVPVSADQATQLMPGWRKPMPVTVQVNGQPNPPWRINMMPAGDGSFYLYLAGIVRKVSGTKVGDEVRLLVNFDHDYRSGPMELPKWIRGPLEANPRALAGWQALSASRRKEVARYLANLKSDSARARNLDRALAMLSGEPGHYMGRDWRDGR